MAAEYLHGQPVADAVLETLRDDVDTLTRCSRPPCLGTILVGNDAASEGYVRKKHQACAALEVTARHQALPACATQVDLQQAVQRFNEDDSVDAFLIQHPLPGHLDYAAAVAAMLPEKDADGLHPANLGRLVLQAPGPVPATPAGILAMFQHYGIEVAGQEVVVIGRGPTLGRPLALLLAQKMAGANAAVTVVHSGVPDLGRLTRRADVVVAAAGVPSIVTPGMVRPGVVAVSGGITWRGKRLLTDVDESVAGVASWITPRLGGVGPTTVAMLLRNAVHAAQRRKPDA